MSTLSADNRLREKVSAIEGTVILMGAGHVDRVVRFTNLPDILVPFKTKRDGKEVFPVLLNLDRGPDQEAWHQAQRHAFLNARRDRPMPEPLPVSAKNSEGWSVDAEDVPVIESEAKKESKTDEEPESLVCESCNRSFNTPKALNIHKTRSNHL